MASILSRFNSIMSANINALLDKVEDPEKMIDQNLRELREELAEVKKETAGVMADDKAAQRKVDECQQNIKDCETAAENALKSGHEDDARKILVKKQTYTASLASLQQAADVAHANATKMRQMHDKLVSDIEELEARSDAIKAKAAVAKTQEHINDMTAGIDKANSSISDFERYEDKVNKKFDSAMAEAELNEGDDSDDLVTKYNSGTEADVDAELAEMKKKLGL
ncbi:MAG: PspA/IM30 family protein [Tractidigestivibacter sp.]|jgi:phage shock protein A|uniref:PspA/IM30 family protein n=1 Tax=Tractidigestivibacter sp. TaxID=2847320 RepID=UPI003D89C4E9